jgi:hypothetical protein
VIADARLASLVAGRLGTKRLHFTIGNRSTIMVSEPIAPAPRAVRSTGMFGGAS